MMNNSSEIQPRASTFERIARAISLILASPLTLVMLIHPALMLDENGHYNHSFIMLVMLGISAGFVHGIGYKPVFWGWRILFSPIFAWPLCLFGLWLWLGS